MYERVRDKNKQSGDFNARKLMNDEIKSGDLSKKTEKEKNDDNNCDNNNKRRSSRRLLICKHAVMLIYYTLNIIFATEMSKKMFIRKKDRIKTRRRI